MNIKKFLKEFIRVYGGITLVVMNAILEILKLAIITLQEILNDISNLIGWELKQTK